MNIDEFIKNVTESIIKGIKEAQLGVHAENVVPDFLGRFMPNYDGHEGIKFIGGLAVTFVDFNIEVSVEDASKTDGKAGVNVVGLGAGVERGTSSKDATASRIRFVVPLILPVTPDATLPYGYKSKTGPV